MKSIPGYASPEATQGYFRRFSFPATTSPVKLGRTGFWVSPVGFGGYRVEAGDDTHREALERALTSGCNLIDTSTNYTDGGSERLVGETLKALISSGKLKREEVVVVTKAGYVQGQNMGRVRTREASGNPYTDVVQYSPDCWHCISPDFLADQITLSLERTGLERLDVLLLHNPEYFLKAGGEPAEYYQRIKKAFEHLETEIARGRISYYGISSNTFPSEKQDPEYTSLEAILDFAGSGFAVIQFPMNLFEPGAALEKSNSGKSVAELARERDLGTLVNRPLNAFTGNKLIRLADFNSHDDRNIADDLKAAWNRAMELEMANPQAKIMWGHIMRQNFQRINDLDTWKSLLRYRIRPELDEALTHTTPADWVDEYRVVSDHLFDAFTAYLENQASSVSDQIAGVIDHVAEQLHSSKTLSQKAIRVYRSIPGIDCILVGMRTPAYVTDAMTLAPPLESKAALAALEATASFELDSHHH